jgi:hypothetical protein
MTKNTLTIDDYGVYELLAVARAAASESWGIRRHPKHDALTIYSRHGYVIHPDLGYVNDEADAGFIATFDPAMVVSILERLASLAPEPHVSGSER